MPEWKIGRMLVIGGVIMLVLGVGALPARGAEPAIPLPQPSPRPTLQPTATPLVPTPTQPASANASDPPPVDPAVPEGHITGTIIDLITGAPSPGLTVNLGGLLVTSDANGNYDHWLPGGDYSVTLVLSADQGEPAQQPQMAHITPGNTVVMHLSFRSQPRVTPTANASTLTQPASAHPASASLRPGFPTRLPVTGEQTTSAWQWMALGVLLLMAGGVLELRRMHGRVLVPAGVPQFSAAPRARQSRPRTAKPAADYDNARLLAELLAADRLAPAAPARSPRSATPNDELLAALLRVDVQEKDRH